MAEQDPPAPADTPDPQPDVASPDAQASVASPSPQDPLDSAVAGGADTVDFDQTSIDELLKQASFEDPTSAGANSADPLSEVMASASAPAAAVAASPVPPGARTIDLPSFNQVLADAQVSSVDLLRDVDLNVKIELGRARMLVEDVLRLAEGAVVELDKLAGDPVDVFVNDRLVARGEVLVLNDNFCVRINEIVAGVKEEGL